MREFFNGWRRKTGLVLLLMAAAVTVAWFRSQLYWNYVQVPFRGAVYSLDSDRGALAFERVSNSNGDITEWHPRGGDGWGTSEFTIGDPPHGFFELKDKELSCSFGTYRHQALVISHLSIAIPLSLLSAYLLLRQGKQVTKPKE